MPPRTSPEHTQPPVIPPIEQVLPTDPRVLARDRDQRVHVAAFERTCRDIGQKLLASATRIVGPDAAPDVVQEALIRGWTHLHLFEDQGRGLAPWLKTITHNTALTVYKQRSRQRSHEVVSFDENADSGVPGRLYQAPRSAEVMALGAQGNLVIIEAMKHCAKKNRAAADQMKAVYLVHILGYSTQAAAEALGMPVGTVNSQASRGRDKLRALIESGEISL